MSLSEEMSAIELTTMPIHLIQKALYYDFVLYNMQQKPFGVLLASNGGAIKNSERGMTSVKKSGFSIITTRDIGTIGMLHKTLANCLNDESHCNVSELQESVEIIEQLYNSSKIDAFKKAAAAAAAAAAATNIAKKTTPAELYDLLNPGDGDINAAIQKAAREIMAYEPSHRMMYLGDDDEVFGLIFENRAGKFLDGNTVAAMRSIMNEPEISLPRRMGMGGRRTRRRGAQQRGAQRCNRRTNRRGCKNKKRTRRH